jgi:hypothetical protein
MMLVMINACEHQEVVTTDLAGAYLHAFLEGFILLKMAGELVNTMCSIGEKYKELVMYKNGKQVL